MWESERDISSFYYRHLLLDFVEKKLDSTTHLKMRALIDESEEYKDLLGSVLLSKEFFESISDIQYTAQSSEVLTKKSFYQNLKTLLNHSIFKMILFMALFGLCLITFLNFMEIIQWPL